MPKTPQRRLGPYVLGPKLKNTGEDLGRVYRARHEETGAPALVIEPNERQADDAPVAEWIIRLSSCVASAHVALEVESAPHGSDAADASEELECLLDDVGLLISRVAGSPETLRHLRSRSRPPARIEVATVPAWYRPALGGALAACLGLLVLHAGNSTPPPADWATRPELAVARSDAGWEEQGDITGAALTGLTDFQRPFAISRPMPKRPFQVQKKAPCKKTLEEEYFGGCWVETKKSAPCPDELYEQDGRCFLPAVAAKPPPASISR